jgi:protein TonB
MLSLFVHAGIAGISYYLFTKLQPSPVLAELDLSIAPALPASPGGRPSKPAKAWIIPEKENQPAVRPAPAGIPGPEHTASRDTGPADGEGGNGNGEGQYVPASQTQRGPRWIGNMISASDYPSVARREGKDGLVVLLVRIDAEGRVRDVKLLKGSYPVLNRVALSKARKAVFTPAYDAQGMPVACEVSIPVRFQLQ